MKCSRIGDGHRPRTVATPAPHRFDHTIQAVVAPNPEDPPVSAVVAPYKLDPAVSDASARQQAVRQLNDAVATDDFALALSNGRRARPTPIDRQALLTVADDLAVHGRAQLVPATWDHLYVPVDGPIALANGLDYLGPPAGRSKKAKTGRTLPAPPSPFDQTGYARIPNNPVSKAYFQAISAGGPDWERKLGRGWYCDGDRMLCSPARNNGELTLYPELDVDDLSRRDGVDVLQALEAVVSSMDGLTLDVMMICLAITARAHGGGARSVTITPPGYSETQGAAPPGP